MKLGDNDCLMRWLFSKFREDWKKIVDFLLMADFWMCAFFSYSIFIFPNFRLLNTQLFSMEPRGNSVNSTTTLELSSSRGVPKCGVHVYNWPGSDVFRTHSSVKHLRSVKAKTYGHPKTSSDSLTISDLSHQWPRLTSEAEKRPKNQLLIQTGVQWKICP